MKKKTVWILVFTIACIVLFGVPALLLMSWSWRIGEMGQWQELIRVGLMMLLPVVPLVLWYSRSGS